MTQTLQNSKHLTFSGTKFVPPRGLRNAHVQTIFSSMGPRKLNRNKRFKSFLGSQQVMLLNGGDGVRLEGVYNRAGAAQANQLAILIHGWEGSHDSTYMKSMAATLLHNGVDVFRLNMRDHGDTHHLNRGVFNSTLVGEVMNAIEDLQGRLDYAHYHLIGFSLGGNFSLRVAAKAHDLNIRLDTVIAFCPVVHAAQSNVALNQSKNLIYSKYFVRKWKRSLYKKLEHWPEYDYSTELGELKTLNQMNDRLIPQYTEFKDLDKYFDAYAITGDRMQNTVCPCYLHFAKDDMIIPVEGVNDLANSSDLYITVTDHGGHCGFIMNWQGDSWQDIRALEIIRASTSPSKSEQEK